MSYDWDKFERPRVAAFNRVMAWYVTVIAAVTWPLGVYEAMRDWTLILVPLIVTAGAVLLRLALRKVYATGPQHPDYSAIAAMEREVYGETFRHEGSIASIFLPKDREPSVRLQCQLGHETRVRGMMPPQTCPTCDEQRQERRDYRADDAILIRSGAIVRPGGHVTLPSGEKISSEEWARRGGRTS